MIRPPRPGLRARKLKRRRRPWTSYSGAVARLEAVVAALEEPRAGAVRGVGAFLVVGHGVGKVGCVAEGCVIGVDLGGTKLLAGAVDADLTVHHRTNRPVLGLDQIELVEMIAHAVEGVRMRVGGDVAAVGFGIPCTFEPLKEGYRGWGYTLGVMKHVDGLKLDCFYEYMNWYTSGFEGAFIARQGYYSAQPENAKKYLTEAEYDYWYGGKPAATDILSPFGKLMEKAGKVRDGGDIWQRLGNIAVWNSVMDEDRYLTRRWNDFITS